MKNNINYLKNKQCRNCGTKLEKQCNGKNTWYECPLCHTSYLIECIVEACNIDE